MRSNSVDKLKKKKRPPQQESGLDVGAGHDKRRAAESEMLFFVWVVEKMLTGISLY